MNQSRNEFTGNQCFTAYPMMTQVVSRSTKFYVHKAIHLDVILQYCFSTMSQTSKTNRKKRSTFPSKPWFLLWLGGWEGLKQKFEENGMASNCTYDGLEAPDICCACKTVHEMFAQSVRSDLCCRSEGFWEEK